MINYYIADLVSRINNGLTAGKHYVKIPNTKENHQVLIQLSKLGILSLASKLENFELKNIKLGGRDSLLVELRPNKLFLDLEKDWASWIRTKVDNEGNALPAKLPLLFLFPPYAESPSSGTLSPTERDINKTEKGISDLDFIDNLTNYNKFSHFVNNLSSPNSLSSLNNYTSLPLKGNEKKEGAIKGKDELVNNSKILKSGDTVKQTLEDEMFFDYTPFKYKLSLISKPGRRVFVGHKNLKDFNMGHRLYILRTSQGIISSSTALYKNIGGELLLKVTFY